MHQLGQSAPDRSRLRFAGDPDHRVDVWFSAFVGDLAAEREAWNLLSAEERARAGRLKRERNRAVSVRTRALLRHVLAGYLEIDAGAVTIGAGPEGKPEVRDPDRPGWPRFNVSHSGSLALIAVSDTREVGVDVERVRADIPWRDVADVFFSPAEVAAIEKVAPARRRRAFFDCWVRKEAYLKGLGTGLRRAMDDFDVPLGDTGGIVHDSALGTDAGSTWYVHPLVVGRGHVAALAADGTLEVTIHDARSAARSVTQRGRARVQPRRLDRAIASDAADSAPTWGSSMSVPCERPGPSIT